MSYDDLGPCMTRRSLGMALLRPPANLTGTLVHRLAEEIRPGRLPTEQELMREAGVSRTVRAVRCRAPGTVRVCGRA